MFYFFSSKVFIIFSFSSMEDFCNSIVIFRCFKKIYAGVLIFNELVNSIYYFHLLKVKPGFVCGYIPVFVWFFRIYATYLPP